MCHHLHPSTGGTVDYTKNYTKNYQKDYTQRSMGGNMNSPLLYIGGKSKLSETIIKMISPHQTYCEVFCGAAWVFFRKEVSKYEVINDLDSDLVTFYRVLQNHLEEFLKQFKWVLSSRE